MTTPIIPDKLRDEYYTNLAKAKIQASVASRAELKKMPKLGLIWSAALLLFFIAFDFVTGRPFSGAWVYGLAFLPAIVVTVLSFCYKDQASPETEQEEARLAAIFAEEDRVREAHYNQLVRDKYKDAPAPQ